MSEQSKWLRLAEGEEFVGLKRTQLFAAIDRGEVPHPVNPTDGGRAIRWLRNELDAWEKARLEKRDRKIAERRAKERQSARSS